MSDKEKEISLKLEVAGRELLLKRLKSLTFSCNMCEEVMVLKEGHYFFRPIHIECPACKKQIDIYQEKEMCDIYDAYYDDNDNWLENKCEGEECGYCSKRPEKHQEDCECKEKEGKEREKREY